MKDDMPTVEDITAAAATALAMERMRGVGIPRELESECVYKIEFASGALWAVEYVREHIR